MLSGSFASAHYGVPRSTQDIDLVIEATPAELRAFVEALSGKEYYADLESALEAHKRQSILTSAMGLIRPLLFGKWIPELDLKKEWAEARRVAGMAE
jgi:hypothetical protein